MPQSKDILQQYKDLHQQLVQERLHLQRRLNELAHVLGQNAPVPSGAGRSSLAPVWPSTPGKKLGMRESIQQVTAARPLGIRELVEGMLAVGFKFRSKNPVNSVGAYLYGKEGKKYFKKVNNGFQAI